MSLFGGIELLAVKFDDQTHAAVPAPRSIADVGLADRLRRLEALSAASGMA
jgi:hypothetical protein